MRIVDDLTGIEDMPSVVVIGKFDGLHLGHRKLIERAVSERRPGMQAVIFTFGTPVGTVCCPSESAGQLITASERRELAAGLGADVLVEYPFNENTRRMSADDFYDDILVKGLHAETIAAGPDCAFGYKRAGDLAYLERRYEAGGIRLIRVEKEQYKGGEISSTRIREALHAGNMEDVNAMLGYSYGFRSEVLHGNHIGHSLGFPTINQLPPAEKALPPFGVYAARVTVRGKEYAGVANVGVKPTIEGENRVGVETYILNFDEDIYGVEADVRLLHFIRPERKFAGRDELSEQIGKDRKAVLEREGLL